MHSLLIHGILPYGRIPASDGYAPVYPCHASNAFSVFLPSFFRLDGNACTTADWMDCFLARHTFPFGNLRISMLLHSMFFSCHVGQAKNPGPGDDHRITIAVCNPTAVYGKIKQLVGLNADIICASETSATVLSKKSHQENFPNLVSRAFGVSRWLLRN